MSYRRNTHPIGGRDNIIPGAIMGSISGAAGQWSYDAVQRWKERRAALPQTESAKSGGLFDRLLESPYFPVRKLSDEQWEKIINDKVLKVDVEIALIDDEIAALKEKRKRDTDSDSKSP